ncbi:MAG TPA: hypothetical protein VGR19_11855 [Allosphingosinicella sp.]|nr:hypothetical protein [Allosphingosinicella sp.]
MKLAEVRRLAAERGLSAQLNVQPFDYGAKYGIAAFAKNYETGVRTIQTTPQRVLAANLELGIETVLQELGFKLLELTKEGG